MKRITAFLLSLCTVFTLCACGRVYTEQEAEEAIDAIGEVSLEDKKAIRKAERIFESLDEEEQKKVEHADVLAAARETYDMLQAEYKRVRPQGKEAALKAVKRLTLVGDWVCVRTDGHVFLRLSEDGTAEATDRYGASDVFTWTLGDGLDSITLDNGRAYTFELGEFAGFTAITDYDVLKDDEEYLIKTEAFARIAEKYYTFVELDRDNAGDYIGLPQKLADLDETLSACANISTAREKGLIYVGVREQVAIQYDYKYSVPNYYDPTGNNGPFGVSAEIWPTLKGAHRISRASGVLIFVAEEYVESVTYSEDGLTRIITMKDGFRILDKNQLTDVRFGPYMKYAAKADVRY